MDDLEEKLSHLNELSMSDSVKDDVESESEEEACDFFEVDDPYTLCMSLEEAAIAWRETRPSWISLRKIAPLLCLSLLVNYF